MCLHACGSPVDLPFVIRILEGAMDMTNQCLNDTLDQLLISWTSTELTDGL